MRILVSGASGFVGSRFVSAARGEGHAVLPLVRGEAEPGGDTVRWDPAGGGVETGGLSAVDAVLHLAGENIASGRWTTAKRDRIRNSRVEGTRRLCALLGAMPVLPQVLVSASAVGFYGDRGDEWLTEESGPGQGFLAETVQAWERAVEPMAHLGVRVVVLRIGMVLGPGGGALGRMLPWFRWGLGGRLGSGRQYVSWISLEDLAQVVLFCLQPGSLVGTVNAVSPNPVTNREFTAALARAVKRPALLPVPAVALRTVYGAMADEVLLAGARVRPRRLEAAGYRFVHPSLDTALEAAMLGVRKAEPAKGTG